MHQLVGPTSLRYTIGIATPLLALLLRLALDPWVKNASPFMLFVPAVMIAAWYGGFGPGLIATCVGAAAGDYFLVRPIGFSHSTNDFSRLGIFILAGVHISWLSGALHRARARAEADAAAARESEERYRTLAANFPNGAVCLFDRGLRWVLADGAGLAAAGISSSQLVGKRVREVLPAELSDAVEPLYRVALNGGAASREIHYGGRTCLVQAVPLKNGSGEISAGLSIAVDVTEAARAREELREARDELEQRVRQRTAELHYRKTLLESQSEASIDGILVVSQEGRVTYFNRRFVELWQVPVPEPMAPLGSVTRAMREKLAGREDPFAEVAGPFPCPSGEVHQELHLVGGRVFECYSSLVRSEDGTSYGRVWFFHDATERRRAEQALRDSERRLSAIFTQASVGIAQADLSGRIVMANRQYCEILGRSEQEVLRLGIDDLTHPDDDQRSTRLFESPATGREHYVTEQRYERPDGSNLWVHMNVSLVRDRDASPQYALAVIQDVSARKRAEAELDSRLRQQAAVSTLGQHALAGKELATLMNEAVDLVAQTLGVPLVKVLELLPGGEALLLRAGVGWAQGLVGRATVGAGRDSQAGYTLLSGEPVIVEDLRRESRFSGPPLLHDHGVRSGISVVVYDSRVFGVLGAHTTACRTFTRDDTVFLESVANVLAMAIYRRRAEETRARLAAVVQAAGEAIAGLTVDGTIETWNPAAERIFGYTSDEAVGRPLRFLVAPDRSTQWDGFLEAVRRGESVTNREAVGVRKDGRAIDVGLSVAPIKDPSGSVAGVAAVCLDITQRKRLEREVLDVCEREQRRMGQDLHDGLGQLLTGVGLMSKALQQRLDAVLPEEARDAGEVVALIEQAVAQARDLARGLRPVALESDALERSLEELASFEQKLTGIRCLVRVDQQVEVPSDAVATHLYRIAQEAVNNAAKHARPSRIVVRLRAVDGLLHLLVEDDGVGIPASVPDGGGMGLQIMQYRARMIGATLEVCRGADRGTADRGTIVECTVPLPSGGGSNHDHHSDAEGKGREDQGDDRGRPRNRAAGTLSGH